MKVGIMQPYFFPYIGYWQLINAVDKFVVYDNIEFTKKSWIRRNRILVNSQDKLFTLPIKKASDYLDVRERYLSETFPEEGEKLLNQIKISYNKSPQFNTVFPIIEKCIRFDNRNLFEYIYHSILTVLNYLEISTEIIISSSIVMDHSLRNKYRVIETCKKLGGDVYINLIGGMEMYEKEEFRENSIELKFLHTDEFEYKQYDNPFIPNLSIIDVMMFNSKEEINEILSMYKCI